jgi:hypothetical protein
MSGIAVERKRAADRWSESLTRLSDILVEYKSASRHLQHLCDLRHSASHEDHEGNPGDTLSIEQA